MHVKLQKMVYNTPMANIFLKSDGDFELARIELANKIFDADLKFFLQHHYLRIENIYDFLHSDGKILALCGFQASGKTKTIECALNFLPENVCKIVLDCAPSICLDDIMLFIYNRLRDFCDTNKIILKKPSTPDFKDVLNDCLLQLKVPIVIVLNSYEHCMTEENKQNCANFLNFLYRFPNIKTILSARQLNEKDVVLKDLQIQKFISKSLEYDSMVEFFRQNGFKLSENSAEKIYEYSRGYYGYEAMLVNILKAFSLTVEDFLNEYETKNTDYDSFLIDKLLALVSDNTRNILEFLSILRINFPINTIYSLNFAASEEIEYLQKKNLICEFAGNIYVKDYIKEPVLKETKTYTKFKIHKFLADFFENQLPLKPKDRAVELSRHTMREEIKFHTQYIKANSISDKPSQSRLPKTVANMSYISYSRGLKDRLSPNMIDMIDNSNYDKSKIIEGSDGTLFELDSPAIINTLQNLDLKLLKQKNKTLNLNQIQKSEQSEQPEKTKAPQQKPTVKQEETVDNILKQADEYTKRKEYQKANKLFEKIVKRINDKKRQAQIYNIMGDNCKKTNDYTNAIEYLEQAYYIYERLSTKEKCSKLLTDIADLYKDIYQNTKAQNLYFQLLSENELKPEEYIRCYLGLIDLENLQRKPHIAYDYFGKIFENLEKINNKNLCAEAYFKFALLKDYENKTEDALKYYELSIETSPDAEENTYISSCYSNIASIYEEKNNNDLALINFQKALEIDKKNNNIEGIYYCNSCISKLLQYKNKAEAKMYYLNAIKYATLINDDFYIASSYLNYGDFCDKNGNFETALEQYLKAKNYVGKFSYDENLNIINMRLNDMKIKLGRKKYTDFIKDFEHDKK